MMRALFWILLLGNVALFAVMLRGGPGWGEQAYQAQPALHEEKIRLQGAPRSAPVKALPVPAATVVPLAASAPVASSATAVSSAPAVSAASPASAVNHAPAADSVPAADTVPAAKPAPALKPAQPAKPAPVAEKRNNPVCLEWGDFSGADLKRATEVLSGLQLGDKLSQRQVEYDKGYWVHIPPLRNKALANQKVLQLRARGVRDYFLVQEAGTLRYAVSLGVFKTQDAAEDYLNELRAKGVSSAQVGERAIKLKTTVFMLDNVDASTGTKLNAMKKDFAGSELKNIPCALTK